MKSQSEGIISVIGASGFIGGSFFHYCRNRKDGRFAVIGTRHSHRNNDRLLPLDITNEDELEHHLLTHAPAFIVFAAGTKDVRLCESDPEYAFRLNTRPVEALAKIIGKNRLSTRVLLLSSDYVFDGSRGNYRDSDPANPVTVYGKSKALAERSLIGSGIDYKIVRTSAVMGRGGTFFDWMINELKSGVELHLFNDVYFSPTPINFLDHILLDIILNYGDINEKILHVSGEKRLSRFEFGLLMRTYLNSQAQIIPDTSPPGQQPFQHDLSLVPSAIINKWRKRSLEEYLKEYCKSEATDDQDH